MARLWPRILLALAIWSGLLLIGALAGVLN